MRDKNWDKLSTLFAMFSDASRLKILDCLIDGENNVSNISNDSNLSISNVSHQLRLLENQSLVKKEKRGKYVYYSLDDRHVYDILNIGLEHLEEIYNK